MSEQPGNSTTAQDADSVETREWMDALSAVIQNEGPQRAHFLLEQLIGHARQSSIDLPFSANTAYVNTIATDDEERCPGNIEMEDELILGLRWTEDFGPVVTLGAGMLYFSGSSIPGLQRALAGAGAAAIGLILANGCQLTPRAVRNAGQACLMVFVAIGLGVTRMGLGEVLAVALPAGVVLAVWQERRPRNGAQR